MVKICLTAGEVNIVNYLKFLCIKFFATQNIKLVLSSHIQL